MDNRLNLLDRRRVLRLRRQDLPEVAKAIVAYTRRQCSVCRTFFCGVEVVQFSPGVHVTVLAEDWDKIMPRITDGTLNPLLYPASPAKGYLHPEIQEDLSTVDQGDRPLYIRVLGILEQLFTEDIPTSNL